MLNLLDDFPIHQTCEPVAHLATTDRNAYDRFWMCGFSDDGEWYFGIAMGLYPHRSVLDCAFSLVRRDGLQRSFFASRRAPAERTVMDVGPFRMVNEVPMRRTRVTLDDNESGLACDLVFSARTGAIAEARQTLWSGSRRTMDATRFDLFGRWSGTIRTPEGDIAVSADRCLGIKDRSWGIRRVGEPEVGGAPLTGLFSSFFLWLPLFWDDHITQAIIFDDRQGRPLMREAMISPLHAVEPDGTSAEDGLLKHYATVRHQVDYHPQTRLARSAQFDLRAHDDSLRSISCKPILRFHMKGIGYGHPEWGHGRWKGELAIGHDCFDPARLDLLQMENFHVQQVVRVSDGARSGIGTMEQVILGPYEPAGLAGMTDGVA